MDAAEFFTDPDSSEKELTESDNNEDVVISGISQRSKG